MSIHRCHGGCGRMVEYPLLHCSDDCEDYDHRRLLGQLTQQPSPHPKPSTLSFDEAWQIMADRESDYDAVHGRMRSGAVERRAREDRAARQNLTAPQKAREAQLLDAYRRHRTMTTRGFERRPDLTGRRSSADFEYRARPRQDLTPYYY